MRIALIAPLVSPINDPPEGGAQTVVADLARALHDRGHDVLLYATEGSAVAGVPVCSLGIESAPMRVAAHRHGAAVVVPAAMTSAYARIYEHVREQRFDVVHNHGFDPPAVGAAAACGLRVLHTLHLPPSEAMAGAITEARRRGAVVWCAAVSRPAGRAWSERLRIDAVLPNGVPVDAIPFVPEAGTRALIASRFSPEKGMAEGIAAARRAGLPVDVFGTPYDSDYEGSIRRRWAGDPQVMFHPSAVRRALWTALGNAAVALCLSHWDEPFGLVAAEAQAAGTPVVASARGGHIDVVRDGVTGFLVDADDPDDVAGACARVGQIDRAACREHAVRNLGLHACVARHEVAYASCAARASASSGRQA